MMDQFFYVVRKQYLDGLNYEPVYWDKEMLAQPDVEVSGWLAYLSIVNLN